MSLKQTLINARAKISDPENWICVNFATDADFNVVDPTDIDASRFCLIGAIKAACEDDWAEEDAAYAHIYKVLGNDSLAGFNDTSTHAEVIALFDKAIAEAES